jgi:hypothetical protein
LTVGLRSDDNGLDEWCQALEARFRPPQAQSLRVLERLEYTLDDVFNGKDPADFIQKIVVHGTNSGIAVTEAQQALMDWRCLFAGVP